jgi:hypothetical protein
LQIERKQDRNDGSVQIFHRGDGKPYSSWANPEQWVRSEVHRLSTLFDAKGKLLVDGSMTLPASKLQ